VFNRHRFTLVVMDNATTAMTGHQDHPGSGRNFNRETEKIPIRRVIEGLGITRVYEVDAYRQDKLAETLTAALAEEGMNAVIASHPCMLQFTRSQRKKPGYEPRRVQIDQNGCRRLHECIHAFACPSFIRDGEGNIRVHPDLCIGDGSCIQTCPTGAIAPEKSTTGPKGGTR
jgi:indolepyruvate ferredoxin oxidoreductase alpha subunit